MQKLTGRCLCEKIAYQVEGPLSAVYNCHCSKCRRWHGAAFRSRATIQVSQFSWVRGEEYVAEYIEPSGSIKRFCRMCGSALVSSHQKYPEVMSLPLGGIEQDIDLKPQANIFVGSKSPWYEICDHLPQYDTWPGSEEEVRKGGFNRSKV